MNDKGILYKNIPNMMSILRMVLVFPFVMGIYDIMVHECKKNWILIVSFLIIIISDIADGYFARKLKCASNTGAKLDIVSDSLYTILSLTTFAYFKIVPVWFVFIMTFKLFEFIITSRMIRLKQKYDHIMFFDKTGKISVGITMLLPGIFVFRCIIIDYKIMMNIIIYIITILLIISFVNRIIKTIKCA